jgi:hypothetical protein
MFKKAAVLIPLSVVMAALMAFPAAGEHAARAGTKPPSGTSVTKAAREPSRSLNEDFVVRGRGDLGGYHLYVASPRTRWAWRHTATLAPAGLTSDGWTGYECLTGDGTHVVAVVAPRSFANVARLRDRGAFAYSVRLTDGFVRPLYSGIALKYYNPGCGEGRTVALTRHLGVDQRATEVLVLDAASGRIVTRERVPGQLTSAVPQRAVRGRPGIVAARGFSVVAVDGARIRELTKTPGLPYMLRPTGSLIDMLVARAGAAQARRLVSGHLRLLGSGPLQTVRLFSTRRGATLVGGELNRTPPGIIRLSPPRGGIAKAASRLGTALSYDAIGPRSRRFLAGVTAQTSLTAIWLPRSKRVIHGALPAPKRAPYQLVPRRGLGRERRATRTLAANTTSPKCAVPRNDLRRQVPQPDAQRVDWAIQQATRNLLSGSVLTRPANFLNMGLASYQPSNDFPRRDLRGWPGQPVPRSVIEGVFAQESNLRQASPRALPGVSANPLIADYYGSNGTLDWIDYDQADCGYGVAQVTDPMTVSSTAYSANGKTKVAVDYAENVPAGIQFLVDKWNQLYDAGITLNGGDPRFLENWYFAIWAYNTGFHPNTGSGPWGLGWTNNPMNGDYCPCRTPFLRASYADAERPADWPYQERVIGWMETPLLDYRGQNSYPYPNGASRELLTIPAYATFCNASNDCDPNWHDPTRPPEDRSVDYCMRPDRKCWWHQPVAYASCPDQCHQSVFTVSPTATEPANADNYPPACNSTLPAGTVIVDDQPSNLNVEGCTSVNWTSAGTFAVTYGRDANGVELGQIDWHQLGTGLGGHIWFTKSQEAEDAAHVNKGTWTPPNLDGVYSIKAHIPPSGASTSVALYRIYPGDGSVTTRVVDQHLHENRWVPLANLRLYPGARVELTNATSGNRQHEGGPLPEEEPYTTNVAFDALAFVPTPTNDQGLAERFRPILRFNGGEDWRPLNVETFFAETFNDGQPGTHHRVCRDRRYPLADCQDITTWRSLQQYRNGWRDPWTDNSVKDSWPVIDIHGEGDQIANFGTPDQWCAPGDLMDCDTDADHTSIYWHRRGPFSASNYVYFGYWFFYRYNKFEAGVYEGDHEADWETATVAVPADQDDPTTFAFVALSSHGNYWHYLRGTLICDGADHVGSCGTTGQRVHAFVADGSHANYPQPCARTIGYCNQTNASGEDVKPEKDHDGSAFWGANNDPTALREFPSDLGWGPSITDPSWVDWYGWWGYYNYESHVESPAAPRSPDAFHRPDAAIVCSERYTDETVNCDPEGPTSPAAMQGTSVTTGCESWNGPYVAVSVCDEARMLGALKAGTLHLSDNIAFDDSLGNRRGAAGRGVAQLVGPPLRAGESVTIRGASSRSHIRVKVRDTVSGRQGLVTALFQVPTRAESLRVAFAPSGSPMTVVLEDESGRILAPIRITRSR